MNAAAARAAVLVATSFLTACVPFPHRHTELAGAEFRVVDLAGRPIAGATLYTYSGNIVGGQLDRVEEISADAQGRASVRRQREWHLFMVFIPDAESPSVFAWCVAAPARATRVEMYEDVPRQSVDVRLRADSMSTACPERLDAYRLKRGRIGSE